MSPPRPIDRRQHVLWHRLRRLGRWPFVGLVGVLAAPLLTVLLFGAVILYFRASSQTFIEGSIAIWIITAPVYAGACAWTFSHMEGRYAATLATRCPGCGYALRGVAGRERCPECGEALPVAPPGPGDPRPAPRGGSGR